jgi:hypothetical protein
MPRELLDCEVPYLFAFLGKIGGFRLANQAFTLPSMILRLLRELGNAVRLLLVEQMQEPSYGAILLDFGAGAADATGEDTDPRQSSCTRPPHSCVQVVGYNYDDPADRTTINSRNPNHHRLLCP